SRADQPSVAQHGDAVCDAINLLHAVADEHHRDAVGSKAGHHLEQSLDLALRKRGGGFIHAQTRASTESARTISTSCCSDVLSSFSRRSGRQARPTTSSSSDVRLRMRSSSMPPRRFLGMWPRKIFFVDAEITEEAR